MGFVEGALFVLGVGSAHQSQQAAASAAREQKEAQRKQTAMEQTKLMESRRQQLREERVRRSMILQRAETLGVGGGSGAAGATGALGTLTGAAVGAQTGQTQAVQSISQNLQSAADLQARAASFGAMSGLAMNVFNTTGGFQNFDLDIGGGSSNRAKTAFGGVSRVNPLQ